MSTSGSVRSKSPFQHIFFMATMAAMVFSPLAARADDSDCVPPARSVPVTGKIQMNMFGSLESLGSIQGVVEGMGRMRCGVHGKPEFNAEGTKLTGYTDYIVCDDASAAESAGEMIHSQIVLASHFETPLDLRSCGGTFREISKPQSGRGIFSPAGGGQLIIEGSASCAGAMDMTLSGKVCVVR